MISVIVPAHNESSVIERTLSAMMDGSDRDELDVIVVCNGCTDHTADIARRFGSSVRVIESDVASKSNALNLGDQNARFFPRIYADADIIITGEAIHALASCLQHGDVLAAGPRPVVNLEGCSWPVRAYFKIRRHLPSSLEGIGGSGVYALSEAGRRRFTDFPNITADDLYVRVQFKSQERKTLANINSTVFAPRTIKHLIAIRTRAHYGTIELANHYPQMWMNKGEDNHRTLIVLLSRPRLWLGLSIYSTVNMIARCCAKLQHYAGTFVWKRDDTSRGTLSVGSPK